MPKYAKFLKGLLTNKSKLEEACTVTMNERCSAVLLNKLRSKEKDPGSFTILCHIGNLHINNALADLGASISLMPYMMYEKLGLGEPKPTRMSLEPAEIDMPEDSRIPIILGRPFLATAHAMIDRPPTKDDECYRIDDLDDTISMETQELLGNDQSDLFLLKDLEKSINQSDLESCNSIGIEVDKNSDVKMSIRRIDLVNMPYFRTQKTKESDGIIKEHLYSASANKIDEKKPELKDLPFHLEYAYLHGNESFPIII
ncbi:reverse transcriptase domain-containing protein [Tanacetum coccineum]